MWLQLKSRWTLLFKNMYFDSMNLISKTIFIYILEWIVLNVDKKKVTKKQYYPQKHAFPFIYFESKWFIRFEETKLKLYATLLSTWRNNLRSIHLYWHYTLQNNNYNKLFLYEEKWDVIYIQFVYVHCHIVMT